MSSKSLSEREKIIAKVRALLAMTTENGCSEAEALTAAAFASKLMEEHDLGIKDIDALKAEPVGATYAAYGKTAKLREPHPAAVYTAVSVAAFFDCRVWLNGVNLAFFGLKDDVALAHDLMRLIQGAMDRELSSFRKSGLVSDGPGVKAQSTSFALGMATRIRERLNHLKAERTAAVKAKGTDLVVIKSEMVDAAYRRQFDQQDLRATRYKMDPASAEAYQVGYRAGDRVGLVANERSKPSLDSRTQGQKFQAAFDQALADVRSRIFAQSNSQQRAFDAEQKRRQAAIAYIERRRAELLGIATPEGTDLPGPLAQRQTFPTELLDYARFAGQQLAYAVSVMGTFVLIFERVPFWPELAVVVASKVTPLGYTVVGVTALVWASAMTSLRTLWKP